MNEFIQKIEELEDIGQKRYLMQRKFDQLIKDHVPEEIEVDERIKTLKEGEGYLYKLSQDFLTASSTLEKRRKLEKIMDHLDQS